MAAASTSSQGSEGTSSIPRFKRLNDAVYEVYKPPTGHVELQIVFFHGFQREIQEEAYFRTWMTADGSVCWLQTWLPQRFPQAHIYAISYYTDGNMDMYLTGENLVQCLIYLEKVGELCPVVFVRHCIGGIVLKQVCLRASEKGTSAQDPGMKMYKTFLSHMRGAFFFSTPHLGTQSSDKWGQRGPLVDSLRIFDKDTARINGEFANLRRRHQWKLYGVSGANETTDRNTILPLNLTSRSAWTSCSYQKVEEASARYDMEWFLMVPGEDHYSVCKPKDQNATGFQILLQFLKTICGDEEVGLHSLLGTLQLPRVFIEMNKRLESIIKELQLDRAEPSRLALIGMSGIGKTTLAKELLLKIRSQFDYVCLIEDASQQLRGTKLEHLVACNLYYGKRGRPCLQEGDARLVWTALRGKRSLVIIDDVDSEAEKQINFLRTSGWCAEGSRLIITSRSRRQGFISGFVIHEVPFMSQMEAFELFTAHVESGVRQEIPKDLMKEVVHKCDGLPLTLEVMGSYLGGNKDVDIWKGALESLKEAESVDGSCVDSDRLWKKLRVSFEGLGDAEKSIFLDLAVFDRSDPERLTYDVSILMDAWSFGKRSQGTSTGLIGSAENIEEVERAWLKVRLQNLEDRCFISKCRTFKPATVITVGPFSEEVIGIRIHEQLRDMGKRESRSPRQDKRLLRRVWHPDDVEQLLTKYKGNKAQAEVVSVASWRRTTGHVQSLPTEIDWSYIGRLEKLRFLRISKVRLLGQSNLRLSPNVTLVHLIKCSRDKCRWYLGESTSWPIRRQDVGRLHKLAVLLLDGCISVRLPKNFHELTNLRILRIHGGDVTELPREFGLLPNLRRLSLRCPLLQKLPDTFNELSTLETLDLACCSDFKSWPVPRQPCLTTWRPLCHLRELRMINLPHLKELPDAFGQMCSLETLALVECHSLAQLPEGFGDLPRLCDMSVDDCNGLKSFCESFGNLRSLQVLYVGWCERFQCLPDSLGQLDSLSKLEIKKTSIVSLPKSIGKLKRLEVLEVRYCENLRCLLSPESLGQVHTLRDPAVLDSTNLGFSYTSFVDGETGGGLTLDQSPAPKRRKVNTRQGEGVLNTYGNMRAEEIDRYDSMQNHYQVVSFDNLEGLPAQSRQFTDLSKIEDGRNIRNSPESFAQPLAFTSVETDSFVKLEMQSESIGQSQELEYLRLEECSELERLPESIGQLQTLSCLNLFGCNKLERLPEYIGQFQKLDYLELRGCRNLERLPQSIGQLQALSILDLSDCSKLERLQESIGQLQALSSLGLNGCSKLERLPESIGQLQALSFLGLNGCSKLERLPESIGQLQALSSLGLNGCSKLERLPESIGQLEKLDYLDLSGCSKLERLPESIGQLQALSILDLSDCSKLETLPESIGQLQALSSLGLNGCSKLERLPESIGQLQALSKLDYRGVAN